MKNHDQNSSKSGGQEEACRRLLRAHMPITERWAYFDHAAVAPLTGLAMQALTHFAQEAAEMGDTVWPSWAKKLEGTRQAAAGMLKVASDQIALVPNTTLGIHYVAAGIDWRSGDQIVVPANEFPSNLLVWKQLADLGVEVRQYEPSPLGVISIEDLLQLVTPKTRLVAISWVGFASGYRIDPQELVDAVHAKGAWVLLDSIQGMGVFPLNCQEIGVDFAVADGHKWMLGPEGAGILYIHPDRIDQLRPVGVGWNSVKNSYTFAQTDLDWKASAARLEGGSHNMAGFHALGESLRILCGIREQLGDAVLADTILANAAYLRSKIRELGGELLGSDERSHQSGIVSFTLPTNGAPYSRDPAEIRQRCLDRGIVVSCRQGRLRVSMHAYNTFEEIDRLVAVL